MKKCYGYLRVSTRGQIDGDGFDRQRAAIESHARGNGYLVERFFEEQGVSGKKDLEDRPALLQLLAAMDSGDVRTIVIERLDRLARDIVIQERLIADFKKQGIELVSTAEPDLLCDDPTRVLMRQIIGSFAQYERSCIVAKLRGARVRKRQKTGRCEGRKPYGERAGEQATVYRIIELHASGKNYSAIAADLNDAGITTRSGGTWYPQTVSNIVQRGVCCGPEGRIN